MVPSLTASMTCRAGTISPPAKERISKLPSLSSLTRRQKSSPPPYTVSRVFGKLEARRHLILGVAAIAGAAVIRVAVPAAAPIPTFFRKLRRSMVVSYGIVMAEPALLLLTGLGG